MPLSTTTVSTKGQVILPKPIRDARRWAAGTRLEVIEMPEGVLLKAVVKKARALDDVVGMLARTGPALSTDDMDAAVVAEA